MERNPRWLPMLRIERELPMLRMLNALPTLRIEPKLPTLRIDPPLPMLNRLNALRTDHGLLKLRTPFIFPHASARKKPILVIVGQSSTENRIVSSSPGFSWWCDAHGGTQKTSPWCQSRWSPATSVRPFP